MRRCFLMNNKKNSLSYLPIGLCIGVAIGAATSNIGLWLPIGLCLGLALSHSSEDDDEDDTDDKQ